MGKLTSYIPPRYKQYWSLLTIFASPVLTLLLAYWFYKSPLTSKYLNHHYGRGILVFYLFYMYFIDYDKPKQGGRPINALRNHKFWKYFRDYFPHTVLHQSGKPPNPNGKYVIGVHPHGIISIAGWCTLMSNNPLAFPGLDYRIVTLPTNFKIPLWRDILMGMNLADSSRSSINYMLEHNISVAIVIGGAAESLDARPGTADLTLGSRLGFIQIAIENGADLIPVFSFGENDVYDWIIDNSPGSTLRNLQEKFKTIFGFTLPLIVGRKSIPILPRRRPIVTVIGNAIHVEQKSNPTLRDILSVHQQYVNAIQVIWDDYKDILAPNRKGELNIVDKLSEKDYAKFAKRDFKNMKKISSKL